MSDFIYLEKPAGCHLQQSLLTFKAPKPRNPSRERVFILSNDSDEPEIFELRLVLKTHSVIGKGVMIHDDERKRIIDFSRTKFRTYSQKLGFRAGKSKLRINRLELGHNIKKGHHSGKNEVPDAVLITRKGRQLDGLVVPIPFYDDLDNDAGVGLYTDRITTTWKEFLDAHKEKRGQPGTLYRGQADRRYVLCPRHFRLKNGILKSRELRHLHELKKLHPEISTIRDLLATVQHNGVIGTILLDWSEDPLVAAFFALTGDGKAGATHLSIFTAKPTKEHLFESPQLYSDKMISFFRPSLVTDRVAKRRIESQKGFLSYSVLRTMIMAAPTPTPIGQVWDIDIRSCEQALADLSALNINEETLGLASELL
jgi:hypothetical protein